MVQIVSRISYLLQISNINTRHIQNRTTDREANCPRWFPLILTFWLPGWVCCWGCEQHLVGPRKRILGPAWSEDPGSDAPCWSLLPWPPLEHPGALSAHTGAPHAPPHTRQRMGGDRGGGEGKVHTLGCQTWLTTPMYGRIIRYQIFIQLTFTFICHTNSFCGELHHLSNSHKATWLLVPSQSVFRG